MLLCRGVRALVPTRSLSRPGVPDIKLDVRRDITEYEASAWVPRVDQASRIVTTFLRHGSSDKRYTVHSPDDYVRVTILVQLPEFKKHNINANFLEAIMMHARPRLMLNAEQTKTRAIQGHTLDTLDLNQLYGKILSVSQYYNHQMWGGNPPDTLVVEISNENYLDNWKRKNTFTPSINKRIHTMRAVRGTAP